MPSRFSKSQFLSPATLSLSGVTLASERTSASFGATGNATLTAYVNLTARSAATAVLVNLDSSPDGGTTWFPVQSEALSAGTGTLTDYTQSKTVSGVDTFICRWDIDDDLLRIRVSGTSGAAGDVVSVTAKLSTRGAA